MAEEVKKPIGTKPAGEAGADDIMGPMMTMLLMVVMISMMGDMFGGVNGEENGGVETAYGKNLTATFSPPAVGAGETLTIDVGFEYRGEALSDQPVVAYLASHRKRENIYAEATASVDLPDSPESWIPVNAQLQVLIPASPPSPDQHHEVYIEVWMGAIIVAAGWFDDAFMIIESEIKELVGQFF